LAGGALALCALLIASAGPVAALGDVTLLGTSSTGVHFDIAIPEPAMLSAEGGPGVEATLAGWFQGEAPGSYGLPERVFMVAVPPEGAGQVGGGGLAPGA